MKKVGGRNEKSQNWGENHGQCKNQPTLQQNDYAARQSLQEKL